MYLNEINTLAAGDVAYERNPRRILVVEKQFYWLKRATETLERAGYKVATAVDSATAVGQILARRPDLILMGLELQGMDGMTLAMHLKAEPTTRDILIVAWTAPTTKCGVEKAVAAGCDGCISKSKEAGALLSYIAPFLIETAPAPRPVAASCQGLNILVVDDNSLSRTMLAELLGSEGYIVMEATDGISALALLEQQRIDAVISDALMPAMDGYQLCHKIRGAPRFNDVSVIVYSGVLTSPESETLASELGAVRFLRKPAPLDTITSTLREVLREAERRRVEALGSETADFGPGDKARNLTARLEKQNRNSLEVADKLLQAHHELLVLSRALAESEESLREKNAQFEEDMLMARETHMALMPRSYPSFPSSMPLSESAFQFHQRFAPKGNVSGDFFDFPPLSDTKAGVFICDVMGHGVRAALVSAVIRGMLVELVRVMSDPGDVLAKINRTLVPIMRNAGTPMFATAFFMTADAASGEIQYANAGHPSPFLVRRNTARIERIGCLAHGPALGLMRESSYRSARRKLAPHDFVMLFTDGIFEVDGPDEELFGQERLLEALRTRIGLPLEQIFDELLTEIRGFSVTENFEDDVCLLGMEVDHLC